MTAPQRVSYRMESTLDSVNKAEEMADQAAAQAGFDEDIRGGISMAVREGMINAVLHGIDHSFTDCHGDPTPNVFVEASLGSGLVSHFLSLVHAVQRGFHSVRNALWRGHQWLVLPC